MRQQKVRLHFLIALTLAMLVFGASRFLRAYLRGQVHTDYVRTEQDLREYTASLLRAEQRQIEHLEAARGGAVGADAAALLVQVRSLLRHRGRGGGLSSPAATAEALDAIKADFNRLRAGRRAAFPAGRPFLRGYHSPADNSLRPYAICVPSAYDGTSPYPAVVHLVSNAAPGATPCYEGAFSVTLNEDALPEPDVPALLSQLRELYSLDLSRVYLTGRSLGPAGCWKLAARHPDVFAGVAPSGPEPALWKMAAVFAGGVSSPAHRRLLGFLNEALSPASYAENLQYSHIAAVQVSAPDEAAVSQARLMAERLKELRYDFEYLEFPHDERNVPAWTREYALAKVFGKTLPLRPDRFSYKTDHVRHNCAWWMRLDRLDDPLRFATVQAEVSDGVVRLSTQNVSALTVLLDRAPDAVRVVKVDQYEFAVPRRSEGREFRLARRGGVWRVAGRADGMKRRGLSGPFSDVLRDPFIVVYGSAGESELHQEISRSEAEAFAAAWEATGRSVRVMRDGDVGADDMRDHNLLLFGGPSVNAVSAQAASGLALPVAVGRDGISVAGRDYAGKDLGVLFCCPNPLQPDRMLAMAAGTTPAALFQACERAGVQVSRNGRSSYKWFDFAVFDSKTAGLDSLVVAGIFDNQWRLPTELPSAVGGGFVLPAGERARAGLLDQAFPTLASAADGEGPEVVLSDVRPSAIAQSGGAAGFDRTFDGRPIRLAGETFARGLGVQSHSSVSFPLGGAFRRFSATVGPTGPADGEIVFEVWGDGRHLATQVPLRGRPGEAEGRIEANVTGVDVLTLSTRPGQAAPGAAGAWGAPTVSR